MHNLLDCIKLEAAVLFAAPACLLDFTSDERQPIFTSLHCTNLTN